MDGKTTSGNGLRVPAWAVALFATLLLTAVGFVYGYGQLTTKVERLQSDFIEMRQELRDLRSSFNNLSQSRTP